MNVLIHGTPFFCDAGIVHRYAGNHELRTFGPDETSDFTYSPLQESASEAIARFSGEWQPDLLLCWQPEAHPPPRGIEEVSVRTVALVSDWNVYYPVLDKNLARFDVVLTDKPGVAVFSSEYVSAHHVRPLYSQIAPIHHPYDVVRDIDVLFIGNLNHAAHHERAFFLERLAKFSDRYRIVITTDVEGEAYGRLMSRARIVFNHSIRGEVNLRVFETMACGAMAMLEESNLEARDWFTDAQDIVLYNESNFDERLAHYLEDRTAAERVARSGHERIASLCGEHTLDSIIDATTELPASGRRFRSFGELERLLQTVMMYGRLRTTRWRPYVAGLFGHLLDAAPGDARVHAAYVHFLVGNSEPDWDRIQRHASQAAALEPSSIPYALNALTVEEWSTNLKPDSARLMPLLEKNGLEGAGLLLGTQADSFWTRCYMLLAQGALTAEIMHAEILIRSAATADSLEECSRRIERAMELDGGNRTGIVALAESMWARGLRREAIDQLTASLPKLPLDMHARELLLDWLRATGDTGAWQGLISETLRILKAFPETTDHLTSTQSA